MAAHRAWDDEWLTVSCAACGRLGHWPHPELGCPCGTVLRIPVTGVRAAEPTAGAQGPAGAWESPGTRGPAGAWESPGTRGPADVQAPTDPQEPTSPPGPAGAHTPEGARGPSGSTEPAGAREPRGAGEPAGAPGPAAVHRSSGHRPPFQPRPIRTARDTVTTAALYLRWLGYRDIRRADQRPPNGVGLATRGLLAQVDPTARPAGPRDVECLWLTAMTESAECVYFSLAGYTDAARAGADALGIPLFVLDLAGVPQPVNDPADTLHTRGAPERGTRARDGQA
ncbi:hypothetical protein [Streptomyces sp. Ru62]|uniref:hypothetical protein n=1 Tax=Streptomyces sp. Ru62 TaxID=2080745 RepID=UPI0027E4A5C1|nr:hypothetical protein [Streptomyces sp. Ru62]